MSMDLNEQVSLWTAYLIAHTFAERYWERGGRADSLTNFIIDTGPVLEDQTVDPAQISDWLRAAEEVFNRRHVQDSREQEWRAP